MSESHAFTHDFASLGRALTGKLAGAQAFLHDSGALGQFFIVCGLVYGVHLVHKFMAKPNPTYTLYLRKLKKSGSDMLGGSTCDNIFTAECNLVADLCFPKLDLRVMKSLEDSLPILSKQEQLHAKMHNQGQAERKRLHHSMARWSWFVFICDTLLLRLGKEIGCGCAGFCEATSGVWFYLPMVLPFLKDFMTDEYVYHAMEELEHGPLTTEYLRGQVFPLTPLLLFPIMVVFYAVYFLFPPLVKLIFEPHLLLKPKTYKDFCLYYCTCFPTFLITLYSCLVYWVLPFRQNDKQHEERYNFFKEVAKARGIDFDVVDQATYQISGKAVKCIDKKDK